MTEIEKKYLIERVNLPDLSGMKRTRIEQHYIYLGEKGEVRIRKKNDKYFITIKGNGTLKRNEWESEITKELYDFFLLAAKGRTLVKDRYEIKLLDGNTAELDIYHEKLEGHLVIEVEFESVKEASVFEEPDWFGKDITDDARYKNKNLALKGWPE
ncbi:MAG: adenylate cyclase [Candidatus Paceibacterota bacterium]